MRNKRIIYIILMLLTCFIYMDSVSATTDMYCRYQSGSKIIDLYCTGNSKSKCETIFIEKSGNKYTFTNGIVKSVEFDDGKDKCPSYANKDINNNYKFGKGIFGNYDLVSDNYSSNESGFNFKYTASSDGVGDVTISVSRNNYGFLKYSLSNNNAGKTISIYDYDNNPIISKFCDTMFIMKGKIEFNSSSCSGVDVSDKCISSGNSKNNDSNSSDSSSNSSSSNSSSSDDSKSSVSSSGSSSNGSGLGVGGYCVYKNLGYCAGADGAADSNCGSYVNSTNNGRINSYFQRAKYAVFKYSTTNSDSFESVYLPKYVETSTSAYVINPSISSKVISDFNSFDGSFDKLSSMLSNYVEVSKNDLSVLTSKNIASTTDEKGCPLWFSAVNETDGQDYEDAMYFYQLYDTNAEDNDNTENPDIIDSGVVVNPGNGPYYCIYDGTYGSVNSKTGTLALFYDPDNSKLKLLSYDFSTAYLNSKCALDDCSTADNVKFVGYGGAESNDGSFQSNFIAGTTATCPKQINYNYNKGILTICKNESSECINGGGGILGNINRFSNSYDEDSSSANIEITSCDQLISDDLRKILNKYFLAFRILVPLAVLALGIIDFAKAVFVSKEEDMKKNQSNFVKRLIVAVAIFLIPTFVNLLLDVANTVWGWNAGTCNIENIDE